MRGKVEEMIININDLIGNLTVNDFLKNDVLDDFIDDLEEFLNKEKGENYVS